CQYRRISSPQSVPGPVRVNSSFSAWLTIVRRLVLASDLVAGQRGDWRLGAIDVIGGRPAGGRLVVLHAGQAFFVGGVGVDEELEFLAVGIADRDSTHEPEVHRAFHLGTGRFVSLV